MWRPRSMWNHGSLSILMLLLLLLVHFHHDGPLVVVSTNWREREERGQMMARDACMCQLSALEVIRYSYVGKFKRPTSFFPSPLFLFLLMLSYFRLLPFRAHSHFPLLHLLLIYLKCHWRAQLLQLLFSYLFPRERHRTSETTHWVSG